jgi:hypothetical protein
MDSLDSDYNKALQQFNQVVCAMTALSQGSAGIQSATPRHYWASVLFTKLAGCAISVLRLLPRNQISISKIEFWDFTPVASLARDLFECLIAYFYLGAEDIDTEEWECRKDIFNIHDCFRRIRLLTCVNVSDIDFDGFKEQLEMLRERLINNEYFKALPEKTRSKCLKAEKLFLLSQDEIVSRMGFEVDHLRGLYILWSSHVHSFPMGFYRTGEDKRGTGLENKADKGYITMTIDVCAELIQKASKDHLCMFPGSDRKLSHDSKHALFGAPQN